MSWFPSAAVVASNGWLLPRSLVRSFVFRTSPVEEHCCWLSVWLLDNHFLERNRKSHRTIRHANP